jgi:hypothetical protein
MLPVCIASDMHGCCHHMHLRTGAFVFKIDPDNKRLEGLGTLAAPGKHYLFPSVAINNAGKGVVGFTLTSATDYPTAAYALVDEYGVGPVKVAAAGRAPQDGFLEYRDGGERPRWGDYGARRSR